MADGIADVRGSCLCADVHPLLEKYRQDMARLDQVMEPIFRATSQGWHENFQKFLEAGQGWETW